MTQPPVPSTAPDFDAWVRARVEGLRRFAFLISGSASDADDLVQEALLGVLPKWGTLVRSGTAEAYVRRSIVNASISRWRKMRGTFPVEDVQPYLDHAAADPATALTDADEAWRLCETLPPAQRAAVVLRFYEDLSYAQIAEALDCAEVTARSHVHRAVASLRHRLSETE